MEVFRISDLTFSYTQKKTPALSNLTFSIEQGDFVTFCGKSGCGKSTLLRHLKTALTPHGDRSGSIYFNGVPLQDCDGRMQASQIGFVLQSPDNQIVTDKVWHELSFGLENLGLASSAIRLRVAEMASFFGIQTWFHKDVTELSGGQKQLLNLAAVMAMQPSVLILDEPTSQLDPIAASEFLETIKKINTELGTTILLSEQRLEEAFPLSDRILVLDSGRLIADGAPEAVGSMLKGAGHAMFLAMPTPMQVYAQVGSGDTWPITVRDGRRWLTGIAVPTTPTHPTNNKPVVERFEPAVTMKNVWFKYEKHAPDTIKGLDLVIPKKQLTCIVGGNGTGKSTALKMITGLLKPYRGKVTLNGSIAMLPQNPQVLFVEKTVELDLYEMFADSNLTQSQKDEKVRRVAELTELVGLLDRHPYDLSGGEQQRAALAKVLLLEPEILLLDEPTKGMDAYFKIKFAALLKNLLSSRKTVVMVSHDIEFCAKYADLCAMFFDGNIVALNTPRAFFSGNSFYTTAANRMARHISPETVTVEEVVQLCKDSVHS